MFGLSKKVQTFAGAAVLSIGLAQDALACAFHSYTPNPTLVDVLLTSEHAVLARPDPSNPRQFVPVAAVLGPTDSVDIPVQVDGDTRARLKQMPDGAVLFARDGAYGPWVQLAVVSPRYKSVIDTVMTRHAAWSLGNDKDRFQVFAQLVNDPDPAIRRLALLELDRADYGSLKKLRRPAVSRLRNDLEAGDPDLRPIRILLAGLSQDKSLVQVVSNGLESAARRDVPYLGAYATALIELAGPDAVSHIVNRYLVSDTLPLATREKIIEALALQSETGTRKTKRVIRDAVANLLNQSPKLAGAVARQYGYRSDWSLSKPLKRAATAAPPTTVADIFALTQYFSRADRAN